MVTINLEALRGGGIMPRASVNGLQFVEAEALRGGGILKDSPVGSSEDVHTVLEWTPEDDSIGNEIAGPVTVNFEATKGVLLDLDFTDTESFDDDGVHSDTVQNVTALELATSAPFIDFEDYLGGLLTQAGNPNSWTTLSAQNNHNLAVDPDDADKRVAKSLYWNVWQGLRLDDTGGAIENGTMGCRFRFINADGIFYLSWGITGSGASMHGHAIGIEEGSNYARMYRWNDFDSQTWIRNEQIAFVPTTGVWYNFKVQFWTTVGVSTSAQFKIWEEGDAEPASWEWGGSDTVYAQAGYVAVNFKHSSYNQDYYWDDFWVNPDPADYVSSGYWESDPIDVSAAEIAVGHRINFDATTPTDTTAAVKCRWGEGDTWLTCTDGEKIPGLTYRELMESGSAKSTLYLRVELATTDSEETPTVDNLIVNFDPCIFGDIELLVDGQTATIANGHLAQWGREQISGGVLIEAFDDLFVQAHSFENYRLNGESISAIFKYDGYTVESIAFSQLLQAWKIGAADGYFAFRGGAIEAVAVAAFTVSDKWYRSFHDYQWTLIDKTQGIHADMWFWVGHAQADDFPGSMLAAELELNDHPGSMTVEGYKRNDFLGTELVQGYRFDDTIGNVLPGVEEMNDFLGLTVVAIGHRTDVPGSLVVFGVNRNNEIEIQTIDSDTVAELVKLGFVFPPEAP